jgi:protein-disulfide isomerase
MTPLTHPVGQHDRLLGARDAAIMIVEYGDYDCPHTRAAHGNLKQLMAERPEQLSLSFRVFPLRHIHQNAEALARLMQAVPEQRFWEAHEALMGLRRMSVPAAEEVLKRLGFDVAELARTGESKAVEVEQIVQGGRADGVHSTPSFFFNGSPWEGHYDLETLRAQLAAAPARSDSAGA